MIYQFFLSTLLNVQISAFEKFEFIPVSDSECYNEKCFTNLTDVYNSPLVECSYL